jgi:hypothetical protein
MSIQKHLDKYYNVTNKNEIAEIALDNFRMSELKEGDKKLLEQYSDILKLSMNACGLKSLNNIPHFSQLDTVNFINLFFRLS